MKTIQWILIGCRVMAVCGALTFLNSGCGESSTPSGGVTAEEAKRDVESRNAMEANAKATKTANKK